ncbi:MAG: beta-aspartyl-peptidase [Candidatus Cloacimonadota bacterium]|nr:MAG: beta-aspartyl-peptidase [Candidatus Cloacimonadota bacterium]
MYKILIHGGAGTISRKTSPDIKKQYKIGLERAVVAGMNILAEGGDALAAVVEAVKSMEDNPLFNAGKGAVFTNDEKHELDASVMDGKTLKCGAVCGVKKVKNPVLLAEKILWESRHILMAADGAERFAEQHGFEMVENNYFDTEKRRSQLEKAKTGGKICRDHDLNDDAKGTVGAVALDSRGNLAAATSTGGVTGKMFGRVGDSPIIGSGTYANNRSCAVSCTGFGEEFITKVVAYDLHARMIYRNKSLEEAASEIVKSHLIPDSGGLIAIDKWGNAVAKFNSLGMFRASADKSGINEIKIWDEE